MLAILWYSPAPAWRLARLLLAPLSLLRYLLHLQRTIPKTLHQFERS